MKPALNETKANAACRQSCLEASQNKKINCVKNFKKKNIFIQHKQSKTEETVERKKKL